MGRGASGIHTGRMDRRVLGWTLVVLQFLLLLALVLAPRRPPTLLSLVIGVPIMAAGVVLGLAASRRLGPALTPTPVPLPDAGLRTDGAYRRVRHPIYSAILLMALGYVIIAGTGWSVAVAAVLAIFFLAKSRWEDRLLSEQYGDEWRTWAAQTGGLMPRWHRSTTQ